MRAILSVELEDHTTRDILLKEGPINEDEVLEDALTGLRVKLEPFGVLLLDSPSADAVLVPVEHTPPSWMFSKDEPLAKIIAELVRCSRPAHFHLPWGASVTGSGTWRSATFRRGP